MFKLRQDLTAAILLFFYRRRRTLDEFFTDSATVNHAQYFHVMFLGCLDILLTLPLNTIHFVISVRVNRAVGLEFWPGWTLMHSDWAPLAIPASEWRAGNFWTVFNAYYPQWGNVPLAIAFFLIFGLTKAVRKNYRQAFWLAMGLVGVKPSGEAVAARPDLSAIAFESPDFRIAGRDATFTRVSFMAFGTRLICFVQVVWRWRTGEQSSEQHSYQRCRHGERNTS